MTTKNLLTIPSIFACFTLLAFGDVIMPASGTSTTWLNSPDPARSITSAINGSGLSGGGTSGDILSETVTTVGTTDHWLSASSAVDVDAEFRSSTEVLTFALAGPSTVNAIHLWPYVRTQYLRSLKTFDISFSTDGGTTYPVTINAATLGNFLIGPTSGTAGVQTKSFAEQTGVTHIRMTNLTNFGATDYLAINELRFGGTSAAAGSVDPNTSTVDASPAAVLADGASTSTITVTLKDASSIPVSGKLVSLAGNGSALIAAAGIGTDTTNANGVATFTVSSSTPGSEVFTATDVTDSNLVITDTASVNFQSTLVDAASSTVSASPTAVPADNTTTSTITVTVKNSGGLALPGKLVALAGSGSANIAPSDTTTDANGVATFTVSSNTVGTVVFTATNELVTLGTANVDFQTVPPADAGTSTVTASPASVPANDLATSTITVTLNDGSGTPVGGKQVSLANTAGPQAATITAVSATTNASGKATFAVRSSIAGAEVFTATSVTDSVVVSQTVSVTFTQVGAQFLATLLADPVSATTSATSFTVNSTVDKLYDGDVILDDIGTENNSVTSFATATTDSDLYADGVNSHTVIFDMGSIVTFDGFVHAQRQEASASTVASIDFWVTNTNPGTDFTAIANTYYGTTPAASKTLNTGNRLLHEYVLDASLTGRYVVMRFISANQSNSSGNPGGFTLQLGQTGSGPGTSYATWSGGAPADGDANGDGVKNAVAYALGAADVNENAIGRLPTLDNSDPSNFVFTFNRSDEAEADTTTTIAVEYGTTLTSWTSAPNVGDGVTVDDSGASVDGLTPVIVTIPKSLAPDGKLFARLKVVKNP